MFAGNMWKHAGDLLLRPRAKEILEVLATASSAEELQKLLSALKRNGSRS